MKRIRWGQLITIVVVVAISLWSIVYNYNSNQVKYGLDLRGGVHLVLEAEAITTSEALTEEKVVVEETATETSTENNANDEEPVEKEVTEEKLVVTNEDLNASTETNQITSEELKLAKIVIEKRINALGVSEATVSIQGNSRIIVDIPGYSDIDQAKDIIGRVAVLTFKDEEGNVLVTGKNLKKAEFAYQQMEQTGPREPIVQLEWDEKGKELFAQGTQNNVGKPISIFLDDELLISPKVNEAITSGDAVITFGGKNEESIKEAQEVAILLQGGSLPVKMTFLEERVVGPSLGQDTIKNSKIGAIIAFLAIILFLMLIYKMLGVMGALALLLYVIIYLGFLLGIKATLSLPAIGAMIISVGMAVDSNVIVFERIKEEYAKGRTFLSAIGAGYAHGWTAIFDSNFAMLLAMIILYSFGTTQIRGFAITLVAGIVAALVTSYFFTQFILSFVAVNNPKVSGKLYGLKGPEKDD
ncbi:MAG: protein translocase subunit SecD [Caldisericia bacterium]|nr:protein translocase subunit SecD [Caldisericia bacterium]